MDVFQQLAELRNAQRRMAERLDRCADQLDRMERIMGNLEELAFIDLGDVRVMPTDLWEKGVNHETA